MNPHTQRVQGALFPANKIGQSVNLSTSSCAEINDVNFVLESGATALTEEQLDDWDLMPCTIEDFCCFRCDAI
jgi:hypothetical protein